MRYYVKMLAVLMLSAFVAACGGGGGSPGNTNNGGATPPASTVSDFILLLDKSTLPNTGAETVKLTVTAVDANNNVVSGAPVAVATDSGTVYIPTSTTTDSSGKAEGQIGIGADKSNRPVTVSVTVSGKTKQTSFQVTGTKITLTVTPAVIPPGSGATATVRVTDAASVSIPNAAVTLSGSLFGATQPKVVTDTNGTALVNFTAPASAGSYSAQAAVGGTFTQSTAQVGNSAVIPNAIIPAGVVPSLDVSPNVLAPNIVGSASANQSQLRFLMLNTNNQPVPNVRVRFEIISSGLGSGDSAITTGGSTVYTDSAGVATSALIAGPTPSPTNGVTVRACYQATEFTVAGQCAQSVQASLTIAAQALAVSIGNDNLLQQGSGTYIKKFVITVADSAGRAVAGAPVDISLDITHYGKGLITQTPTFSLNAADIYRYFPEPSGTPLVYPSPPPTEVGFRISCVNEDRNRNGFVDPGDNLNGSVDSNGQPTLEPRRSDIILSYADPAVRTTNANGILQIQVEYSQRFATWLSYRIKASTNVSGSQGLAERAFVTSYIDSDLATGSFRSPPYGFGACDSSN
jgi:Bacterial Ig-like domain (group 1)